MRQSGTMSIEIGPAFASAWDAVIEDHRQQEINLAKRGLFGPYGLWGPKPSRAEIEGEIARINRRYEKEHTTHT